MLLWSPQKIFAPPPASRAATPPSRSAWYIHVWTTSGRNSATSGRGAALRAARDRRIPSACVLTPSGGSAARTMPRSLSDTTSCDRPVAPEARDEAEEHHLGPAGLRPVMTWRRASVRTLPVNRRSPPVERPPCDRRARHRVLPLDRARARAGACRGRLRPGEDVEDAGRERRGVPRRNDRPVSPTMSGMSPAFVTTTGFPQAIASATAFGKLSESDEQHRDVERAVDRPLVTLCSPAQVSRPPKPSVGAELLELPPVLRPPPPTHTNRTSSRDAATRNAASRKQSVVLHRVEARHHPDERAFARGSPTAPGRRGLQPGRGGSGRSRCRSGSRRSSRR